MKKILCVLAAVAAVALTGCSSTKGTLYGADQNEKSKYPSINVTDENALMAQKAAVLATEQMFECVNPEN